jgi:hypothetical protein
MAYSQQNPLQRFQAPSLGVVDMLGLSNNKPVEQQLIEEEKKKKKTLDQRDPLQAMSASSMLLGPAV